MKNNLLKSLLFAAAISAVLVACRSSKVGQGAYCNIKKQNVQFGLRSSNGFEDLRIRYPGYATSYERLVDSLKFSNADTIALFIRPCFSHRGIFFNFKNRVMSSSYFDFTKQKREVITLTNSCDIAQNYFAFLTQDNKAGNGSDTVIVVPDCPVDFYLKIGASFFYGTIPGPKISRFSRSSMEFKALINQTDSLTRIYSENR